MPEFELDPESLSRADSLSSRLMDDFRSVVETGPRSEMRREIFSEERYAQQAREVPINDVVENVSQMATEFAAARRWDGEIPCLEMGDGELAPISLTEFFGGSWPSYGSEDWFEFWERYIGRPFPPHRIWREVLRRADPMEERVRITSLGEAEGGLQRSLSGFLSYRFAGIRKWAEWIQGVYGPGSLRRPFGGKLPPPPPPPGGSSPGSSPVPPAVGAGGGLQVQVSCLTPGLRLHISPAYFISWVYFGSPTTPVSSYVLPGRYIFAGDGPMLPRRRKDPTVFCIPADYYPTLTRF
jgi:hypothetical protein